jgi:hypothetical protein
VSEKMEDYLAEMAVLAKDPPPFRPHWYYNATGDQVEVYLSDEPATYEWLNHFVSIGRNDKGNIVAVTLTEDMAATICKARVACLKERVEYDEWIKARLAEKERAAKESKP